MKSSTQVNLPFLLVTIAGMLNDAQGQGCASLSTRPLCIVHREHCTWLGPQVGCVRRSGTPPRPRPRPPQDTLFNIIPSDSDEHDYAEQEDYAVDMNIDSGSGDDVSDEFDLYLSGDEDEDIDMDKDEDIKTDFSSHQKTRLRGSASGRNTYFSAISVGGGSRGTCRQLVPNQCMERSDCRLFCQGNRCRCDPK